MRLIEMAELALAVGVSASSPGMLPRDNMVIDQLERLPSGCDHSLKYWDGFTPFSSYEDAAVPTVLCGSGGDSVLSILFDVRVDDDVVAPLTHNETIAVIRRALSLQIKELAEILHVQRPTIYSWINNEAEPYASNRDRLLKVFRIASKWNCICKFPADRWIKAAGTDGHSVLDLLKWDEIDESEVVSRFELLATQRMKMKADADRRRPTSASIMRSHGLDPNTVADQQHVIDAMTGKRSHPE